MKSPNFTLLVFILMAVMHSASAQLNGIYTVGGTSPDYATVQAAASAAQTGGVTGPVTFNIRPGTYIGKVDLGVVNGTSATNTLTFQAENNDSTSVIITDTANNTGGNFTFHVFSTDYLIIKNLTIQRTGASAKSCVINIAGNSKFIQIKNCVIQSDNTNDSQLENALVFFPVATANDSSITITNNVFNRGWYSIHIKGQSSTVYPALMNISNNQFNDPGFSAVNLVYAGSATISNNVLNTLNANFSYEGFYLRGVKKDFKITGNSIGGIKNGDGIVLDTCIGLSSTHGLIANNFISTIDLGFVNGITVNHSSNVDFYFNTIHIATGGASNAAITINSGANDSLNFKNNILVNTGGGITYNVGTGALASMISSDYNDLYTGSTSPSIAFIDTGYATTFADWQAASGKDANSVSGDPQFNSVTDLHSGSTVVNDNALPIAGITVDIDGQTRSVTTPDMGADEFTPLSDNVGIIAILAPVPGDCSDSLVNVVAVIRNFGLATQTGFNVNADVTGDITATMTEVYSGSLTANATDTITFTQTFDVYNGGAATINVYTSLGTDQFHSNDSLSANFFFNAHPNPPSVFSPQDQCDNNLQVTAYPDTGDVLVWYDQPTGGNLLHVGDLFSTPVSSDTTFYVESHRGSGGVGCLRITEIDPDDSQGFDFIEVQNLSNAPFDATGWKVVSSADNSNINAVMNEKWDLGFFNAGEAQYRTDVSGNNYWGANLNWTGGSGSWAMIIDAQGNIVDLVIWDWDSLAISTMNLTVDAFTIIPGAEWSGNGYNSCGGSVNQRIGSDDHNVASDWGCGPVSMGALNANLSSVFQHCGIGLCGSARLPVEVHLVPGVAPVNLGNDTMVSSTFSINLDAGTGYSTYDWSTGETTQSITVTAFGTYWVTVTGGPFGCPYTDSIVISLNVGVTDLLAADDVILYPNPATDKLMVSSHGDILNSATLFITDIKGQRLKANTAKGPRNELMIDLNGFSEGMYFLQIYSGNKSGVKRFTVMH